MVLQLDYNTAPARDLFQARQPMGREELFFVDPAAENWVRFANLPFRTLRRYCYGDHRHVRRIMH
jgi:hypothetical protein